MAVKAANFGVGWIIVALGFVRTQKRANRLISISREDALIFNLKTRKSRSVLVLLVYLTGFTLSLKSDQPKY